MHKVTKTIKVGNVLIGGTNHVVIQSMTNTKTKDIKKTIEQINKLEKAGCEIVRVAVTDLEDAQAIKEIKKEIKIPIVADIHFDYRLALAAITAGVDKIRINPGNIKDTSKIKLIVDACKEKNIPIRIGINSGSIEQEFLDKYHGPKLEAMLASMDKAIKLIESFNFYDLVLSVKATNINDTIIINEELAKRYNYPIHIGLTESGTFLSGTIRSSYTLGTILAKGIGSTIRVSLHGDPIKEIGVAKEILSMFNLYTKPTLIVCPTCGRTEYNITPIVEEIEKFIQDIHKPLKVAIMGCVVNGPGEAKEADIGIAGGKNSAVLFKRGKIIKKLQEDEIIETLKTEIIKLIGDENEN